MKAPLFNRRRFLAAAGANSAVAGMSCLALLAAGWSVLAQQSPGWQYDRDIDRDALPVVPSGFEVSFFAREPLVRQPCAMAFDARGRLCVGMGPQYRNPKPDTPGDSVVLVLDTDGDGRADRTQEFAAGFNAIQALAWHGRDLWVANAPDLTVVRDLDGDDVADEYVRVYTDLGNLEHGLHGLNWAPDGRLYMSKGNSKGLSETGRVAPKPFRDLWGVTAPAGSPDFPPTQTFTRDTYRRAYHDPADDWGREGGVLRCEDGGANLEIVSRGMRNPWDITFDAGFNWLGTDNDQTSGDRVFMPFPGAHFGWNHPWSAHWGPEPHPPTAPVSGPLFEGSGTGIVFGDAPQFPASHRGVFFINDWLRKTTFVWRPRWDGALLRPAGDWEPFVQGGRALFRPTDLEFGPDGALWILGWGSGYGAEYRDGRMTSEGRVFRVAAKGAGPAPGLAPKRGRPHARWTVAELVQDLDGPLPVWRIDAQDELVRRGDRVRGDLVAMLEGGGLGEGRETWVAWALGRMAPRDRTLDAWFASRVEDPGATLNLRVQALRILGHRARRSGAEGILPGQVAAGLRSPVPRIRFEAVQAIGRAGRRPAPAALLDALAVEADATAFYAGWQVLRGLQDRASLRGLLGDPRGGVRKAALLALLEDHALGESEVRPLTADPDPGVGELAALWLRKAGAGGETALVRGRPLNAAASAPSGPAPAARVVPARGIRARSGARYLAVPGGLLPGAKPYTDRPYELKEVPPALQGLDYIRTANDDDGSRGDGWLVFEALVPVRVHVALDARAAVPAWLREKFRRSDATLRADHWTFHLHTREFPAGTVELGGNTDDGRAGGKGNYIVLLEPLGLTSGDEPTGIDAVFARVEPGDPGRGEWLFHASGGAGCHQCHRLGDHGNAFGPDLAGLGGRATFRHVIQSILEPGAVITEGFNLQVIGTSDAEYSGILLEESGLSLTIGLATGERRTLPKSSVTSRRTESASAMPSYGTLLTPGHVADLAAYLMTRKEAAPAAGPGGPAGGGLRDPEPSSPAGRGVWPEGDGFRVAETADRLLIAHSGRPVGEFVFGDAKILRPHFANLHAPEGTRVTRNHPPVAGEDATDHDTMHPGLWLGFGDVDGQDFWRNKGRIRHVGFVEPPSVLAGRLVFATGNRLEGADGRTVCGMTNRVSLDATADGWLIVWEATFRSDEGDFVFGDQEEMGFGARVATAIMEKNGGVITSSAGLRSAKDTWGRPADWCDYSGRVAGRPAGILLMADPGNFRPSWWHNRDYGVFVANPFGRAAMGQGDRSAVVVRRGETFRLRFGAVLHHGADFRPAEAFGRFRRGMGRAEGSP